MSQQLNVKRRVEINSLVIGGLTASASHTNINYSDNSTPGHKLSALAKFCSSNFLSCL